MGKTLKELSRRALPSKAIFNNRFVVEVCEKMHVHYRNLRIVQSLEGWTSFAEGVRDALDRWKKRGEPSPANGRHIELTRKEVGEDEAGEVLINLNDNLYLKNEGGIFAEGADLKEEQYIHFKLRDLRVELTIPEFLVIAEAVDEAKERLKSSGVSAVLRSS